VCRLQDAAALVQFTEVALEQAHMLKQAYQQMDKGKDEDKATKLYAAPMIPHERQERQEHQDRRKPLRDTQKQAHMKHKKAEPLPKPHAELVVQDVEKCPTFKWGIKGIYNSTIQCVVGQENLLTPWLDGGSVSGAEEQERRGAGTLPMEPTCDAP
jgi:hypothetical protein